MPYKLIEPCAARRTAHYRIRGTEFGAYLDRSTGTADRREAMRILKEWRDQAKKGLFAPATGPTFASAALSYAQAGGEKTHLPALVRYFKDIPLAHIGQTEIDAASHALYPVASPATRNRHVYTPISAVMRHAGHVIVLRRPKDGWGKPRRVFLQPDEAKRLLEAARGLDARFGAFLTFLLYTGCRLREAVSLKPADLHLEEGYAYVRETKNGQPRTVHLPQLVVVALRDLPRYPVSLFGLSNIRRAALLLEESFRRAGVPKPDGVAFHLFRHTFGAWMRRYGGLDTTGLVATGAWKSRNAASVYEHAVASEEARRAELLPVL